MNPAHPQGSHFPFRRQAVLKLALLLMLTAALALAAMVGLGTRATDADPSFDSEEQAFLTLINDYRVQNGLAQLATDCRLNEAADWFANDMATDDYWPVNHYDNEDPPRSRHERAAAFGFDAPVGENIAGGYATADSVFQAWKASSPHDSNMLGGYVVIGIGRAYDAGSQYGWYWVTDFATFVPPPAQPQCGSTATPSPPPTPAPTGTLEVSKDFLPNDAASVTVTVACDNSATPDQATKSVTELAPATFTISLPAGPANCTATESPAPPGYIEDNAGCAGQPVTASGTTSCLITNTLTTATITVSKDFSDNNTSAVTIGVACQSGVQQAGADDQASDASGSAGDATFTITGFSVGDTCTVSESGQPAGYAMNPAASTCDDGVTLAHNGTPSCSFVNTNYCAGVPWPVPVGDDDCDGFTTNDETATGTDSTDACADTLAANDEADDKWPPDFDDNRVINTTDVFQLLPPTFGTAVPPTSFRRDLFPDGVINTTDVFRVLPPFLGSSCAP